MSESVIPVEKVPSAINAFFERTGELFGTWVTNTFGPALKAVFHPMNDLLAMLPAHSVGRFCAIAYFILAIIWVYRLKKEYVNLDAPGKSIIYDLRVWTVLALLPHFIVYIFFPAQTN